MKSLTLMELPKVEKPEFVLFCDFDETYYPHEMTEERALDIHRLEDLLVEKSRDSYLLFGIVTGSGIDSVLGKMQKTGYRFLPHFIAADLGTEIHYFNGGTYRGCDRSWKEMILAGGYSTEAVDKLVADLSDNGILLTKQPQATMPVYKRNYYFICQNAKEDDEKLETIRVLCALRQIGVNISRCNPLAGDPENAYDIDFIPLGTGKAEVVAYILKKFAVPRERAIAFGDSGNDLEMLQAVKQGYLLGNATEEAKSRHGCVADGAYSKGIKSVLEQIV
ncbi:MAG: HAD-IIB family hydrolase [Bacillus sp. (in: firmicutes)]